MTHFRRYKGLKIEQVMAQAIAKDTGWLGLRKEGKSNYRHRLVLEIFLASIVNALLAACQKKYIR